MTEAEDKAVADGTAPKATVQTDVDKRRKIVTGTVRSDKMRKTITVELMRLEKHPRYHKYVRRRTTYKAHDERDEAREGDVVRITETRPLSKNKRWRLVDIVRRAKSAMPAETDASTESASAEGGSES